MMKNIPVYLFPLKSGEKIRLHAYSMTLPDVKILPPLVISGADIIGMLCLVDTELINNPKEINNEIFSAYTSNSQIDRFLVPICLTINNQNNLVSGYYDFPVILDMYRQNESHTISKFVEIFRNIINSFEIESFSLYNELFSNQIFSDTDLSVIKKIFESIGDEIDFAVKEVRMDIYVSNESHREQLIETFGDIPQRVEYLFSKLINDN